MKKYGPTTVLCGACIEAVFGKKEVESLTIGLVLGACSRCGTKLTAQDRHGHFREAAVRAATAQPARNEIALTPVKSSNVEAMGYDEATKTARVRFKGGQTYRYTDVPKDLFEAVVGSQSVGKAAQRLRAFPCTREAAE